MSANKIRLFIDIERLPHYAENVGKTIQNAGKVSSRRLAKSVLEDLKRIRVTHDSLSRHCGTTGQTPAYAEWLLDNWYIAQREGKEAYAQLRRGGKISCCAEGRKPAVLQVLCRALLRSGDNQLTPERMEIFLTHFQKGGQLSQKELSLFIPALKAALIEALADVCQTAEEKGNGAAAQLAEAMEHIFTSLRLLANLDPTELLERANPVEQILRQDPAGAYPDMEEHTRTAYRSKVARLAAKGNRSEAEVARCALRLAREDSGRGRHIGYYLFEKPLGRTKKRRGKGPYIGAIVVSTVFLTLLAAFGLHSVWVSLLLFLPIWHIVKNVADFLVIRLVKPCQIPRMELKNGVPAETPALCVLSLLLTSEEGLQKAVTDLEEHRLANRDGGAFLYFGLLVDLKEATERTCPEDDGLMAAAKEQIQALNQKYGGGFYLFARERRLNQRDGRYMGWERKRGAILELLRLLRGRDTGMQCLAGERRALQSVQYVITLDSDTRPGAGTLKELVGAMLHPLNQPVIDAKLGAVKKGTGLLQPRISMDLESANQTDFTRIFAGQGGVDPYGCVASDVYQDLLGEGTFTGKGILDVDAYLTCLDQAFPENKILSHDLLEGAYLNCQYIGDVEFTDGYPRRVLSYYERMHRWVRGDWQTLPWLARRVRNARGEKVPNPISEVSKFKIFDNLRRSLVPVSTAVALHLAMFLSGVDFAIAGAVALLSAASGLLLSSAGRMFQREYDPKARYHSAIIAGFAGGLMETLLSIVLLPYEAYVCFSAILTALYRMIISKKKLLSWTTAAQSDSKNKDSLWQHYVKMYASLYFGATAVLFSPYALGIAMGIIWLFSPAIAKSLGRTGKRRRRLGQEDRFFLERCAGEIWRYFAETMTAQEHYLPPDNWQEQPAAGIAPRTSPTNIGLALLSILAAMDLHLTEEGAALNLAERLTATVEGLPKWRGHLYNWYNTRTLRPLPPAYVSTVDSGNLAGCLIAVAQGFREQENQAFHRLGDRLEAMYQAMDFAPLYDPKRRLLYIGWDMEKDAPTQGWYDLLESEARQTSYIAIAKGDVERRHWRRLGRVQVSEDHYSGMASWTGTMFEYLMPNLLLPCYPGSLLYESARFCVSVQKKRGAGRPWGVSERAYYAFDPAMNYRYKAHGVQRLALRRGMGKEYVVSPYASFLALSVDPAGAVWTFQTPDAALNGYLNGWAMYQTIACRMLGRSSLYQCGGAYGFRDQLQDALAAVWYAPALARDQILRAAGHQFVQGDVQHWWHPGEDGQGDKGVRTRCSDDLIWLPYALCDYMDKTGDVSLAFQEAPYLQSPTLQPGERERYETPAISGETGSLLEHGSRALNQALERGTGAHGLARMGSGDWNDGMDRVGARGKGESVWLTWFLAHTLERFADLCQDLRQDHFAQGYRERAAALTAAANAAWDGQWFLRGYFDSGAKLGSRENRVCQVDAISQGFAVLPEHGDKTKAVQAVQAAAERLFDRENRLVKLFDPPFDEWGEDPGYIRSYGPGFRENGGQYTHGALWLCMGCFDLGLADLGWQMLSAMLPSGRPVEVYRTEPYVLAADVYANPQHMGRGGWTWYTGAAGWYFQVVLEHMLGLKMRRGRLYASPQLPSNWTGARLVWRRPGGDLILDIERDRILINGAPVGPEGYPLGAEAALGSEKG